MKCPRCEKTLDAGHRVFSGNTKPSRSFNDGDLTVCGYCGLFAEFRTNEWVELSAAAFDGLLPDEQDALVQGRAIARLAALKMGRKFPAVVKKETP